MENEMQIRSTLAFCCGMFEELAPLLRKDYPQIAASMDKQSEKIKDLMPHLRESLATKGHAA